MFVKNWMSSPAVTTTPSTPARKALEFMEKHKVRRLPVVDGESLAGIVTKSDLHASLGRGRGARKTVRQVMTKNVLSVAPDETLEGAARIMFERKISGLPVVESDRVVGIITESDLFRALCSMLGIGQPSARIVLNVPSGQDLLKTIAARIEGMDLRSMATYRNASENSWEVVLRVRSQGK